MQDKYFKTLSGYTMVIILKFNNFVGQTFVSGFLYLHFTIVTAIAHTHYVRKNYRFQYPE